MARADLNDLIDLVREFTGADQDEVTDNQIVTALNATREEHFYVQLHPEWTPTNQDPDVFFSREPYWDNGYGLTDGSYNALTEATTGDVSEPLNGRFVLSTTFDGAVLITGRTYDPHIAAAVILENWAARVSLDFDFSADGQSFSRSQKQKALLEMAKHYRRQARPKRGKLIRPDEES